MDDDLDSFGLNLCAMLILNPMPCSQTAESKKVLMKVFGKQALFVSGLIVVFEILVSGLLPHSGLSTLCTRLNNCSAKTLE